MTMTFAEAPAKPETSLQRRQREKREAEKRGQAKSKAELAAEETARREAALGRSLLHADPGDTPGPSAKPKSKGLAMMARMGFAGGALGAADNADARTEPLRINIKEGRGGIGADAERKRQLAEAAAAAGERVKRARVDQDEYRDRVRRKQEAAVLESRLHARRS